MNFIDLLKRSFMDSWTGGASGEAGKYHAPGAFDNFKAADLFDNDRWIKRQMVDTLGNPKFNRGGDPVYTNYYNPREEDITDVTKIEDGKEIRTISRKYKTGGSPERTAIKGPPRYTDVPQDMSGSTRMYPPQHSPFRAEGRGVYHDEMPGATRMYPPQRHTSARTYPYEMNTVPPPVNTHVPGVVNGQAVDFPLAPQELPGMDLKMRTDILRELVRLFIRRSD
jgi:hypothetical protein